MGLFDRVRQMLHGGRLTVADRFEVLRESTSGTMSQFLVVRDRRTQEIFGLKLLDKEKTEFFEARFKGLDKPSEAQIAMSFHHPRIVKTLEVGLTTAGEQYLLMEFLDGPGLNNLIRSKDARLVGHRITLARHMAESIDVIHQAGYIHRDICPRNFICSKDVSSLKLIDFGLTIPNRKEFTTSGNRTGTPNYMAPEILRRRPTDQRIDIFALGVTIYQLFAWELPWPGQDASGAAAVLHDTRTPTDIRELCPSIHPRLAGLIHRCLAADPAERPPNIDAIQRILASVDRETQ